MPRTQNTDQWTLFLKKQKKTTKIYSIHIRNHVQSGALCLPNIAHSHSIHSEEMHIYICSNLQGNVAFSRGLLKCLQFSFSFAVLKLISV